MGTLEYQLVEAIRDSNISAVRSLLDKGCKIDLGDVDNVTPLHLAAMRDRQEIAELLIASGANVNSKTTEKMAALHYAAVRGLVEMVELLLRGGATVDPLDAQDRTPLLLAVTRGHLEVVQLLISYGARVNIESILGYTPLCEAVWKKSAEIAELLLEAGAKQTQSQHLLHYAVLHRHHAIAELLLRHGAYPNLRNDEGDTPLTLAVSCAHIEMVRLLLHYEANPNHANYVSGVTPLHNALRLRGHDSEALFEEILRLLCRHGADLNNAGGGAPPLTSALLGGHMNCAAWLVRAGADVNRTSDMRGLKHPSNLELALSLRVDHLVHLILAAGFDMSKYNADFPKDFSKVDTDSLSGWLTYAKFNPRRLTDLCRLKIRSQLGNKALHLIPTLEIPQSLKKFLLFQDIYVPKYQFDNGCDRVLQTVLYTD